LGLEPRESQFATIDLEAVAKALLRKWPLYIVCFILGAALLFVISNYIIPKKYEASVQFYVNSTQLSSGAASAAGSDGEVNSQQIDSSRKLANTYIVILQNPGVRQQVADRLEGSATAGDIASSVTMAPVQDTEVIQITARTNNADMSMAICDAYAATAPEVLERVVQGGSVEIIDATTYSYDPVYPNVMQFTALGGLGAVALALIIVYLMFALDKTVKNRDEISQHLDTIILGEIPSFGKSESAKYAKKNHDYAAAATDAPPNPVNPVNPVNPGKSSGSGKPANPGKPGESSYGTEHPKHAKTQ
jgi:capsular polysaccharide biosynthesis protein